VARIQDLAEEIRFTRMAPVSCKADRDRKSRLLHALFAEQKEERDAFSQGRE
jgi:hypothetical protein